MTPRHIAPALIPLYLRTAIESLDAAADCTPDAEYKADILAAMIIVKMLLNGGGQ